MQLAFHLFSALATFAFMEFWAWFVHKHVQHGPLWVLHRSHHVRPSPRPFERNDWFFVIYGVISTALLMTGAGGAKWWFWVGVGIAAYGSVYFFVHDGLIHGRLPFWKKTDSVYLRALNMAHKMHHKTQGRDHSQEFGLLWVAPKYLRLAREQSARRAGPAEA